MKKIIVGVVLVLSVVIIPQTAQAAWYDGIIDFITGGSSNSVSVTLSSASPLKSLIQISKNSTTENVLLAKYDIKSQGTSGTLRKVNLNVQTTMASIPDLFRDIKIDLNGHTYSTDVLPPMGAYNAILQFSNLNEVLPANQSVTVSVFGRVNADASGALSGATASTSLQASFTNTTTANPLVEDANGRAIQVNPSLPLSSEIAFSSHEVVISATRAELGSVVVTNNESTRQAATFGFTVTAGNETVYISADPEKALLAQSTGLSVTPVFPIAGVTANPGTISGDSNTTLANGYYVVPAGSSRTFTYTTTIDNTGGLAGLKTLQITAIKFGTNSSAPTSEVINYGLGNLRVATTLGGSSYPAGVKVYTSSTAASVKTSFDSGEGVWISYYVPATTKAQAARLTFNCPAGISTADANVCGTTIPVNLSRGSIGIYRFNNTTNLDQKVTLKLSVDELNSSAPIVATANIVIKAGIKIPAPSISSVTNPIQVGGEMSVKGTTLISDFNKDGIVNTIDLSIIDNYGWVLIDGVSQKGLQYTGYGESGSYLSFKLPQLTLGQHTIAVKNESGTSTPVSFTVSSVSASSTISVALNAASPLKGLYQISKTATTNNVLLAKYDVKSSGQSATLNAINIGLVMTMPGASGPVSMGTVLGGVKININGQTFSPDVYQDGMAQFTNLRVVLPTDQYVTVGVYGDVKADTGGKLTGSSVSTSLVAGVDPRTGTNPLAVDSSGRKINVNPATLTSSTLTFSSSDVIASGLSATLGNPIVQNNTTVAQSMSFTVTLTAGNDTVYVSKDPNVALTTILSGVGTGNQTRLSDMTANPGQVGGDASTYYVVPAGSSRTFTFSGTIDFRNTLGSLVGIKVSGINYGVQSNAPAYNRLSTGLDALKLSAVGGDGAGTISSAKPISVNKNPANSGETVTFKWGAPSGSTVARVTLSCQDGISARVPDPTSVVLNDVANLCSYNGNLVTHNVPVFSTGHDIVFTNTGKAAAMAYVNYNYVQNGVGNTTVVNMTINPGTTTPITPTAASSTVTVVSPNTTAPLYYKAANSISWKGGKDKVLVGIVDATYEKGGAPLGWINLNGAPTGSTIWNGWTVTDLSGSTVSALSSLGTGPYKIIVVSANATGNYCFRSTTTTCNVDLSNAFFPVLVPAPSYTPTPTVSSIPTTTTATPTVTITTPSVNTTLIVGQSYTFRWSSVNAPQVTLTLVGDNGTSIPLATNITNTGSFTWIVKAPSNGGAYRLNVYAGKGVNATSNGVIYFATAAAEPQTSSTPTPSYTPSYSPTPSYTPSYSPTPSYTPYTSSTPTPSYTPTYSPSYSPTSTYTPTPSSSSTYSPSPSASVSASPSSSASPSTSASPTSSASPSTSSTPKATSSGSSSPSPSGSGVSFNTSHNLVANLFYTIGDLLDAVF